MRVLVFTNMYPSAAMPFYGSFVRDEAEALREAGVEVDVYFVNGRANKLNYFGMPRGFLPAHSPHALRRDPRAPFVLRPGRDDAAAHSRWCGRSTRARSPATPPMRCASSPSSTSRTRRA